MLARRNSYPFSQRSQERLASLPSLARFAREVSLCSSDGDYGSFERCRAPFGELVASPFMSELIDQELGAMVADPHYFPIGSITDRDLAIYLGDDFTLSIQVLSAGMPTSKRLCSGTEHQMIAVVPINAPSRLTIETFSQTWPGANEVFDRTKALSQRRLLDMGANDVHCVEAGKGAYRIVEVGSTSILLYFSSRTVVPLRWEYDATTLFPIAAIAASPSSSRFEYVADLLARVGGRKSVEGLLPLTGHEDHFVRWSAAKAIVRLDQEAGAQVVRSLTTDPHPHVRRAAERAMRKLTGDT